MSFAAVYLTKKPMRMAATPAANSDAMTGVMTWTSVSATTHTHTHTLTHTHTHTHTHINDSYTAPF